jgi:hypothetical protein
VPIPINNHPNSVVISDLDGDGDLDVVTPGVLSDDLLIFENDGRGTLTRGPRLTFPGGAFWALAGDFDEDGRPDLALSVTLNGVHILLGDGRLGFTEATPLPVAVPGYVAAGDLDGDGHTDLVVSVFDPAEVVAFLGDGKGGFTKSAEVPVDDGATNVTIADADADGRADVLVSCSRANRIAVLAGDGAGGLGAPASLVVGDWPTAIRALGDGRFVATTNLGNTLAVIDPTQGSDREIPVGNGPIDAAVADLDGDGVPEIAITDKFDNTLTILKDLKPVLTLPTGDGPTPIAAGDIDGDGRLDLVVLDGFTNDLVLYLAR